MFDFNLLFAILFPFPETDPGRIRLTAVFFSKGYFRNSFSGKCAVFLIEDYIQVADDFITAHAGYNQRKDKFTGTVMDDLLGLFTHFLPVRFKFCTRL